MKQKRYNIDLKAGDTVKCKTYSLLILSIRDCDVCRPNYKSLLESSCIYYRTLVISVDENFNEFGQQKLFNIIDIPICLAPQLEYEKQDEKYARKNKTRRRV